MPDKLKDQFFTPASLADLAAALRAVYPEFPTRRFLALVQDDRWPDLELKAKMRHVTAALVQVLPARYDRAVALLMRAAPAVKGFEAMCLPDFVELRGLGDWPRSLRAMACFTRYSSSEFAIRPFLVADLDRALAFLAELAGDEHENVRRFASEGCRPRLPWAAGVPALKKDPTPILAILEALRDDESEFVRRSVSNNLNDIAKDHPGLVLDLCERWQGESDRTDWVIKRGCRTLLKRGNLRAMRLFGFGDPGRIEVSGLRVKPVRLRIGDRVEFSFTLAVGTKRTCQVRLEYAIHFVKKNGRTSPKVFQISEKSCAPGPQKVTRRHSFADMSTRKHHPGQHRLEVIVNGVVKAGREVTLTA